MLVVSNAFSVNMLDETSTFTFVKTSKLRAREIVSKAMREGSFKSIVGHNETAVMFGLELDVEVPCNRTTYTFRYGDAMLIGQYSGPRLPEGATKLPEGAKIQWWTVEQMIGGE